MEITSPESILAIRKETSINFGQQTQPNNYTSVQPMFGCQNGLTEDRTRYAKKQASFDDGYVPLYIVHDVKSLNTATKQSLQIYQFSNRKESDTFSEQRSACNDSGEFNSVEIEKFPLIAPISFSKQSFDLENYQQQQDILQHFPCYPVLQASQQTSPHQGNPNPKSESCIILPNCSDKWPVSQL
jgi:hypothetical protein